MACTVCSTATARKPSAAASALSVPMAWASSDSRARAAVASSGWSPLGPKIAGKAAGWMRPSTRLASVTVAGPPRP